ncbi:MAG: hypothetical protein IT423_05915 [Pirellulaceae bacterium]|nr:hypothetical protein [Pirellulaceae bacterium]
MSTKPAVDNESHPPDSDLHAQGSGHGARVPVVRRSLLSLVPITVILVAGLWLWNDLTGWRDRARIEELFRTYRDHQALELLRHQLLVERPNATVALQLVRVHRRLNQLDTALMLADAAEQLGASDEALSLQRQLIAVQAGQIGDFDKQFSKLIVDRAEIGSEIIQAYVLGLFANQRMDDALGLLSGWEKSSPADAHPKFLQAYVYQGMDQISLATEAYRRGLELAPKADSMRLRLAALLIQTGDIQAARRELSLCQTGRQAQFEPVEVHALLAACDFADNLLESAAAELDKVLKVQSNHIDARRLRGRIRLARNQAQSAVEDLQFVSQLQPGDLIAREALARALQLTGRDQEN